MVGQRVIHSCPFPDRMLQACLILGQSSRPLNCRRGNTMQAVPLRLPCMISGFSAVVKKLVRRSPCLPAERNVAPGIEHREERLGEQVLDSYEELVEFGALDVGAQQGADESGVAC